MTGAPGRVDGAATGGGGGAAVGTGPVTGAPGTLPLRVHAYVGGTMLVAVLVTWRMGAPVDPPFTLLAWFLATLATELLWVETLPGQATTSVGAAMNFASLFMLSPAGALWVIGAATFLGTLVQRRRAYRAVFGGAAVVPVVALSASAFRALARIDGTDVSWMTVETVAAMLVAFVAFFLSNTLIVAGVISLSEGQPLRRVWRENFAHPTEIRETAALFAMSPLIMIVYRAVGWPGFLLFAIPLIVHRNASLRFMTLERTQRSVLRNARLAAKGEMAAEIAHELNNSLAALGGNAQLLEHQIGGGGAPDQARVRARTIHEQVERMRILTEGLVEFAHRNAVLQETDLVSLVERTVAFLRPQSRFDGIDVRLNLDENVGLVAVDQGQLQQVIVNLLFNAADATRERQQTDPTMSPVIEVALTRSRRGREIGIAVRDHGTGIDRSVIERIFEPTFTTKSDGHGFGLATCHRIVQSHGGRIEVDTRLGHGATFTVVLPTATRPGAPGAAA